MSIKHVITQEDIDANPELDLEAGEVLELTAPNDFDWATAGKETVALWVGSRPGKGRE